MEGAPVLPQPVPNRVTTTAPPQDGQQQTPVHSSPVGKAFPSHLNFHFVRMVLEPSPFTGGVRGLQRSRTSSPPPRGCRAPSIKHHIPAKEGENPRNHRFPAAGNGFWHFPRRGCGLGWPWVSPSSSQCSLNNPARPCCPAPFVCLHHGPAGTDLGD